MALTKINNNTLSAITGLPAGVGGKVLQTVYAQSSTEITSTSSTWVDVLSLNITPSATSSKILVLAACGGLTKSGGDTENQLRVLRGATEITETKGCNDGSGSAIQSQNGCAMNELDEPNTTSETTYKIQIRNRDSAGSVRISNNNADTSLTLMEIAG